MARIVSKGPLVLTHRQTPLDVADRVSVMRYSVSILSIPGVMDILTERIAELQSYSIVEDTIELTRLYTMSVKG